MASKEFLHSDLADTLREILIPQAMSRGIHSLLLAPSHWQSGMDLPEGMTAEHVGLRGKGTKKRASKPYGKMALVDEVWKLDHLHSARMPLLCFVVQGPVVCQIADYALHCDTGHAYLIPPGIPYADGKYRFLDETKPHHGQCTRLQLLPYHNGLYCWRTHNWIDAGGGWQINELSHSLPFSLVPHYLSQLRDELAEQQTGWDVASNGILQLLLGTLFRELQHSPFIHAGKVLSPAKSPKPQHAIARIEQYIHQNLERNLTIETLSHRVGMSRTAFTMQFRARTGKSLVEYLIDLRLTKAKELLLGTDLAIRHIAAAVGIKPSRLRSLFQQRENCSPTEYRNRQRED